MWECILFNWIRNNPNITNNYLKFNYTHLHYVQSCCSILMNVYALHLRLLQWFYVLYLRWKYHAERFEYGRTVFVLSSSFCLLCSSDFETAVLIFLIWGFVLQKINFSMTLTITNVQPNLNHNQRIKIRQSRLKENVEWLCIALSWINCNSWWNIIN